MRPQLDCPQRLPEHRHIRYQPQHIVRHPRSSQTPHTAVVEIPKEVVVGEGEVIGDGGKGETGEKEINVDASEGALDDGDESFGDTLRMDKVVSTASVVGREGERTATSATPSVLRNISSNKVWNSSRSTCFGTTRSVSISEPGPCTPRRYDPKVKILPPLWREKTRSKVNEQVNLEETRK